MSGLFITMEGTDGSGKSTQINMLKEYLEKKGYDVVFVREPGGTKIGEKIREIILDPENNEMEHITEALLYASSRAQLVNQVILPALKNGKVVLCDRFVDSSIVYQGIARDLGEDTIAKINRIATGGLKPDITIFLNLSPEKAMERKKQQKELDRLENEKQYFYNQVYYGYKNLAKKNSKRIKTIDASKNIEDIYNDIITVIEKFIYTGGEIK
ncbi:MAG: dTMP kinase [Eubacteriales bacterium]|nr:dTMP kinase [Eubacteriales bacterium]